MPLETSRNSDSSFRQLRSRFLETLNIDVEEYEHKVTGAKHFHLASDNPENVFMVALRTVPMDSTGVAHILEHTALCGSKKFPVRDPFFMMIRRSMNTFMNAMTSSDWTAYPFASQNRKDFNNLLEVYLDAVFFSRLDPMDFSQEGHRLEFAEANNPETELEYKGVVYNEMKGAMSSQNSIIWQHLCKHLYPTTTYHYNSGGDPADIPNLSYEQLLKFYKTHYHPSNAIFMTFGDIPASEHQEKFEALALEQFDKLDVHIAVGDEKRYQTPIKVLEQFPLENDEAEDDLKDKSHVLVSWLLGQNTNLEELFKAQLLSSVLLDNSASPLLQVLETTDLGASPSPLCGLEDSHREMSFICGLESCDDANTDAIEELILSTLKSIAEQGVEQSMIEAALHSLELHQREITGDSYPYGLQLILSSLSTATHRGDPIELLDIDPVLKLLKKEIQNPDFLPGLIKDLLLDNPHRVTLTVVPNSQLAKKTRDEERQKLDAIKSQLSDSEKLKIVSQAQALSERQQQVDDMSILPKVDLDDVPADINWPQAESSAINKIPLAFYPQGTNGLSYQDIIIQLPALPDELKNLLPLYSSCLPELGVGSSSYLEIQALQASISGGIHAHISMRNQLENEQSMDAYMILGSKALYANQDKLSQLMKDTLESCRFDELSRIKELIQQIASHKEQSVTSQGHVLAMGIAASKMSAIAELNYENSGMQGILNLKSMVKDFNKDAHLAAYAEKLQTLHELIIQGDKRLLCIAEASEKEPLIKQLNELWMNTANSTTAKPFAMDAVRANVNTAWLCNTQVNFCATAFPSVPAAHKDTAALTVLGGFLRNGYLHGAIREQGGAYGGGATQDSGSASFRFYSYRDPRLSETLDDFEQAINWLHDNPHDQSQLEEAILGVISSLDKPASPAGTAKQAYYNELFGRDKEHRAKFRQQVLEVDIPKLQEVAANYLTPEKRSVGIISSKEHTAELEKLNLKINSI
ncbi:MAG: peptidase M16 [SAR86 cluster bacterium]|uniref:Peptidase M16 n=1 Tax=SAR86 cluster bacterium TaxID=2030880 RepID=A0A2A5C7Q3_9GAMM|nr:MAG: peptidase M16 [SAR86 cluster bacterium]